MRSSCRHRLVSAFELDGMIFEAATGYMYGRLQYMLSIVANVRAVAPKLGSEHGINDRGRYGYKSDAQFAEAPEVNGNNGRRSDQCQGDSDDGC